MNKKIDWNNLRLGTKLKVTDGSYQILNLNMNSVVNFVHIHPDLPKTACVIEHKGKQHGIYMKHLILAFPRKHKLPLP